MKRIHTPTLLMHILLIILAVLTMNDYPDLFLWVSIAVLLAHVLLTVETKGNYLVSHTIGIAIQLLFMYLGVIREDPGPFGLGGGGFALFFYQIALAVSFGLHSLIGLVRLIRSK